MILEMQALKAVAVAMAEELDHREIGFLLR